MTQAESASVAQNVQNEDFAYKHRLPEGHVFVVGDFANSDYKGLDKLAETELRAILADLIKDDGSLPPPVLLSQVAVLFNNKLLAYKEGMGYRFQCCAVLAAVTGRMLHFLPVGDCRVALVRRGDFWQLNGTLWLDAAGKPLPPIIKPQTKVKRGAEFEPADVLGYAPVNLSPSDVQGLPLEENDVLLLYSDGVDKMMSPVDILSALPGGFERGQPGELVSAIMKEAAGRPHDDDCTLLVATGPHEYTARELAEQLRDAQVQERLEVFEKWLRTTGDLVVNIGELRDFVNEIGPGLKPIINRAAMNAQDGSSRLDELERRFEDVSKAHLWELTEANQQYIANNARAAQEATAAAVQKLVEERIDTSFQRVLAAATESAERYAAAAAMSKEEVAEDTLRMVEERFINALEQSRNTLIEEVKKLLPPPADKLPPEDAIQPATGDVPPDDQPDAQSHPDATDPEPTYLTKLPDAPETTAERPAPEYLHKLTHASRFREGVLQIRRDGTKVDIRLLDEVDVYLPGSQPETGTADGLAFAAGCDVPPGWLTAFYCDLLLKADQAPDGDTAATEDWVLDKADEFVRATYDQAKLSPAGHLNLRKLHWELRGSKLGMLDFFRPNTRHKEVDLARRFHDAPRLFDEDGAGKPFIPLLNTKDDDGQTHADRDGEGDKKKTVFMVVFVIGFLALVLGLAFFGGTLVQYFFGSESPDHDGMPTPTPAVTTPREKLKLVFDADGRTAYLIPTSGLKPLDYNVPKWMQTDFRNRFFGAEFEDSTEARRQLTSVAASLVKASEPLPDTLKEEAVAKEDLQPSGASNGNCLRFLARVNKLILGAGNHTHLDELLALNPALKCEDLKEGQMLSVYQAGSPLKP